MRKLLLALLMLLSPVIALGQSTTLSGSVTDSGSQTWNNGTVTATFVPPPQTPNGPWAWTGGTIDSTHNTFVAGVLDGSGNYSISVPDNNAITPVGSKWTVTVFSATQPVASATATFIVTGGTQTHNFTPGAIHADAGVNAPVTAYTDVEVSAMVGQFYYNLVSQGFRVCQVATLSGCTTWVPVGGSGPGGVPRLDQVLNPNVNKSFNLGSTTLSFVNGTLDLSGLTSPVKLPIIAGCATASAGQVCYDSTLGNWKIFNTVDSVIPTLSAGGTYTTNDVLGISNVAGKLTVIDLGPVNGGSGSSFVQVTTTNILDGDGICWDAGSSSWINCTPGVPVTIISATSYLVNCLNDRAGYFIFTAATAISVSLPQAATSGTCDANFFLFIRTLNADLTVTPTVSTIDDGGGAGATLVMHPGYGFTITSDNSNYTAKGGPYREGSNPLMSVEGFDVNTKGGYDWQAPNNASPGTILNKMACDDGTGKLQTCAFATSTTNNPVGSATTGIGAAPGTTGNTAICFIGFCNLIFDGTATANHFAQLSPTVNGDLHDTGATTRPTNGQPYWYVFSGCSGAECTAVIRNLSPSELNAAGNAGGKSTIQVNGTGTQPINNFNATTPAAGANNQNLVWQTSASGNTSSISVEVPLATTGQAGLVQLTGGLGGTSASPTLHTNHGLSFTIGVPGGTALTVAATTTDYITVPFACTINAYNLNIDAGTITVKFWKVATGTAIPTSGNSISTSGVGISSGTAIHSTTVTDFTTTAVAANDIMAMNVTAVATAAFVNGVLSCQE